jgi:hypothetical protein
MKSSLAITLLTLVSLLGLSAGVQAQNCSGHHVTVHANQGTGQIIVTPEVFNEKKGCGFEIHVPAGMTTNIISQTGWLSGSSNGGPIRIDIPAGEANGDYKYDVEIIDFGYVDPRIRVF